MRPLPFGFIADTAIFTSVPAILFIAVPRLRAARRRRRGLCGYCAYPIGAGPHTVCSECGRKAAV